MTPPLNSPPVDYAVISNQNLFHPERKIPPERQAEKTVPRPDVVLYGTLITGETSFAFLEDRKAPYSTAGRGKRQVALKKGDSLGGYILSEIEANRIVLLKGKDKITVMLDDKGKRRGEETPTSPAAARTPLGGVAPSQPLTSSPPPTAPSSVQSMPSPGKATGIPGPVPSSAQPAPSSRPGSGASGSWPPTRSTIEQTQQKIREGQHMRSNQIQQN